MKLKLSRLFCLFLLLSAAAAFGFLYRISEAEGLAEAKVAWLGVGGVLLSYGGMLYWKWNDADRLLMTAGGFAVLQLWMLSLLGF